MSEGKDKTKYCPYCGAQIDFKYSICPNCGKPQPLIEGMIQAQRVHRNRKNPILAFILSLLITGVGQIYLGKISRGLVFLASILIIGFFLDPYLDFNELAAISIGFSLVSAYDAYRLAKKMNSEAVQAG